MSERAFRTRLRRVSKSDSASAQLTVPASIARALPPGSEFELEITDDGLLFRFVGIAAEGTRHRGHIATLPFLNGESA